MNGRNGRAGLPPSEPSTWLVWLLAANFVGLGLLFLVAPRWGAGLFGLPAPEGASFGYLPAIGLRDLAFGFYLLILSLTSGRWSLGLIFGATVLIPVGDMIVVAAERGLEAWGYLLLHGLSAAIMTGTSAWLLRQAANDTTGGLEA